jgi:hypothetical protein
MFFHFEYSGCIEQGLEHWILSMFKNGRSLGLKGLIFVKIWRTNILVYTISPQLEWNWGDGSVMGLAPSCLVPNLLYTRITEATRLR